MEKFLKHKILIALGFILIGYGAMAQLSSFKPQGVGLTVNSDYSEFNPVISIDGKTLYFSRANHPENRYGRINSQDIWYSQLNEDGTWSQAKRLPNTVNIGRYNAILSALNDGKTFLINGKFNKRGTRWVERGMSLIEKIDDNNWGKPQALNISGYTRMNKGKATTAYMTPDREYLFISFTKKVNSSRLQIYVSKHRRDLSYTKPQALKGGVNDGKSNEAPFLTSDGNVLYFSTNSGEGKGGYNIMSCNRADDSYQKWSKPMPISDVINSDFWDSYYKLNAKGSWAYFSSNYNSTSKSDIYRVKIYEENPFVKVTGLILNQADQSLMLTDTSYRVLVNGKEFPGLKVDKSSASYEAMLPLGGLYSLAPDLKNWIGIASELDATALKEYTESKLNLYIKTIPFVYVKGKIIDTRTNMPVNPEKNPKVLLENGVADSIKYDMASSSYSVLLPLGKKYVFKPFIQNYTGKADTVDVLNQTVYMEKDLNLYLTSVPWVEVKGYIIDNYSMTPILANPTTKLVIDGNRIDSINIDPATGEYKIRLPFGKKYQTSAEVKDFGRVENTLDLTGYVEFASIKHDIYAESKDNNMAIVSGTVMNTKTGKPVDPGIIVKMKVNGIISSAFKYDSTNATFTLKLPVGYSYDLIPSVYNFYNKFEPFDLQKVAPKTKIARNFYVTPIEVGQSVDIENIYFETGKAGLKPTSFRSLNALVAFLNEYPNVVVEISGHTDNIGSAAINLKISEQRAKAVADYVKSMGVQESRIVSKGYGMTRPKYDNKTSSGRSKNRRVEFTITGI